jgi:hypothetical protein
MQLADPPGLGLHLSLERASVDAFPARAVVKMRENTYFF